MKDDRKTDVKWRLLTRSQEQTADIPRGPGWGTVLLVVVLAGAGLALYLSLLAVLDRLH